MEKEVHHLAVNNWCCGTKQGGYLILRLDDLTQEAVLESVSTNDIKTDQGVTKILAALDKMFEVDKSVTAYEA